MSLWVQTVNAQPSGRWWTQHIQTGAAASSALARKGHTGMAASPREPSRRCPGDQHGIGRARCSHWRQDQMIDRTPTRPKGGGTPKPLQNLGTALGKLWGTPELSHSISVIQQDGTQKRDQDSYTLSRSES